MVLLNSAIREQRRDPQIIDNNCEIIDTNLVLCGPDSFSASFDGFTSFLPDCKDLHVISDWICEPDCFEMANKLEEKHIREEFSPISFTIQVEDGVSSPIEVDNVGAKFGEVCLDGHGDLLLERGYFGDLGGENEFRCENSERAFLDKVGSENPKDEPQQCPSGINEEVFSDQHAYTKTMGASAGALNNVSSLSDKISVGGEYNRPRPTEICVADNSVVERRDESFEKCDADKVEVRLHGDRDFGERVVPNKSEVCLEWCGDVEHGVANDKFSIVETDGILKEASHNVNLNGGGVPGGLVTGPPTILNDHYLEDTNLVQRMVDTNGKQTENEREFDKSKGSRKEDSAVESGEIVSYDENEDCVGMEKPERGECSACTAGVESEEDHTGIVEPDSEYCSDSSSSSSTDESEEDVDDVEIEDADDEEIEEGEIKPEKGKRKVQSESFDYEFGSSDEEGPKGPVRSKNEIQDLPLVPPVTVVLESHHQMKSAGVITSVLGTSIVVEGKDCHTALNEGTILWTTEKRLPLGLIDEVFGPVKNPYYLVRFNDIKDVPDFVKEGVHVSYVPEFSKYILNDPSLFRKGYDASGDNDEELCEEIEFSDDEKEAEYKRARSNAKRGVKSRQNTLETKSDRAWKKQEFMDKRKTKLWGVKSPHNGNHANELQGRIQETKFSSKKPFGNSSRNLPPVYNNGKQQSPQHLGPRSASVKQMAVLSKESENLWHGPKLVSGASSSWGRVNSNPNRDASGGMHSVQFTAVGGQSACSADHKVNSASADHSRALHDQAQGIKFGPTHLGSLHDQMGQTFPSQLHASQPSSSSSFQQPVVGINSNQSPVLGRPMLNGNLINVNPMGFPSMPMFPAHLGQPAQSISVHPGSPVMAWNVGHPNNAVRGSQLPPQNANQGVGNPLHFNQMQTCVGIPVLQNPGLHTNMQMNMLSNMEAVRGHNVLPCPMPRPWGQPIPHGNLSQQNQGVSFCPSNNMSGNIHRLPHPYQPAKDRQS